MNSPQKYKSIPVSDVRLRRTSQLSNSQKTQVTSILQRLTQLIKLKHS